MNPDNNNYKIVRLKKGDVILLQKLVSAFNEIFETGTIEVPQEPHLAKLLEKKEFIALAILAEDEVLGGLTAYEIPLYYNNYSEAYIYDLGIKSQFQRKGLGKKLIEALKNYCAQHAIKLFFVEANEEDTHAIDFYRSIGGQAEKVVHFNYPVL